MEQTADFTIEGFKHHKHGLRSDKGKHHIYRWRSGSGKTSIAKRLFSEAYILGFEYWHKCVLDDFPEGLETGEITKALCSVGFASPHDWLKAYDCLSQGEKMRVDIARALCLDQQMIVIDEFKA